MFEIVKREHIRQPSFLVSATSDGVTAPLDRMCSASINVFGEIRRQVFLIVCVASKVAADIDHESDQVP